MAADSNSRLLTFISGNEEQASLHNQRNGELVMNRNYFILLVVVILAGCANPRVGGSVKEQRLIQPDQRITILWDVGVFCHNSKPDCKHLTDTIYSKQYEACTTAHLKRTFYENGYNVKVFKVQQVGEVKLNTPFPKSVFIDTPYVLLLRNTTAKFQNVTLKRNPDSLGLLTLLNVESELYDRESGHMLWQGSSYWAADAKGNGTPSLQLVRALAADGFLNRKIEDVVDYMGRRNWPKDTPEGCPE